MKKNLVMMIVLIAIVGILLPYRHGRFTNTKSVDVMTVSCQNTAEGVE